MRTCLLFTLSIYCFFDAAAAQETQRQVADEVATERLSRARSQFKYSSTSGPIGFAYWFENAQAFAFSHPLTPMLVRGSAYR